jgi:hypothetical protein
MINRKTLIRLTLSWIYALIILWVIFYIFNITVNFWGWFYFVWFLVFLGT